MCCESDNFIERCEDHIAILRNVIELVDFGVPNLRGHLTDVVLEACGMVCGRKRGRICKRDTCCCC